MQITNKQKTNGEGYYVKRLLLAGLAGTMIGCSGNPYVTQAERNDVVTLGDSIFDLSGELQQFLEAPEKANTTFRDYTLSGAKLSGGFFTRSIIRQYQDAKNDDPNINVVVMDGGGNDILQPATFFDPFQCRTNFFRTELSPRCKSLVDDIYVDAVNLLNDMQQDGVKDVVYLGYYYTTGDLSNLHKAIDYGDSRLADACNNTLVSCQYVDPRSTITANDVLDDNLHPTTSGSQKLADLIWPSLKAVL